MRWVRSDSHPTRDSIRLVERLETNNIVILNDDNYVKYHIIMMKIIDVKYHIFKTKDFIICKTPTIVASPRDLP